MVLVSLLSISDIAINNTIDMIHYNIKSNSNVNINLSKVYDTNKFFVYYLLLVAETILMINIISGCASN